MLQLKVVNRNLISQKYRDENLESDVRLSVNSQEGQNMVPKDGNAKPQRTRVIEECKNLLNITSLP